MGSHRLSRRMTESLGARIVHKALMEKPAAPETSGSLHEPMAEGREVAGGVSEPPARRDQPPPER